MGTRSINDDHASDLSHVQEVHGVVGRLRQLFAAAFEANQVSGASRFDEPPYQSAPGR
ncbi:MAG: hypothetical protein ACRD0C_19890 [Acidimicrobiia bacterium]